MVLVTLAKTLGPIWMMGFLVIVVLRAYGPRRRAGYERAGRSILDDGERRGRP